MQIRAATSADIDGIQAVGQAAWRDTCAGLVPDGYIEAGLNGPFWSQESFRTTLVMPQQRLLVVEDNGQIVGMLRLGTSDELVSLWQLYLLRHVRGQGLGRALWQAAVESLAASTHTWRTSVVQGNPALAFYQRLGFTITHTGTETLFGYEVPLVFLELAMHNSLPQPLVGATLHDQVFASLDAQVLEWLKLAPGSHVLDAGCGPGGILPRFAAAVGPSGSVTGLDQNSEQLAEARQFVAANTHSGAAPVSLREGDLLALPFDDGSFDLAWCSFVLHHIGDLVAAARELRRVVRPGGRVVVRETGVPLRMLPFDLGIGRPGLQDRLRVAFNQWFVTHRYPTLVEQPYPWGWLQLLRDAGCQQASARTFWLELLPPFTPAQHDYLLEGLRGPLRNPERLALLDADDQQTLARLTDPNDPYYALNRPDLHVLAGISLYVGQV